MFQFKIFVLKFSSINRHATSAIEIGKIATLCHKTGNNSMKNWVFETETRGTDA